MCPPRYNLIPPSQPELPYSRWLDTAICCKSNLFSHRETKHYLCIECYADKTPSERYEYDFVSRHYINLGSLNCLEECDYCSVVIPRIGTTVACAVCPLVLRDFIEYLQTSQEAPYASHQPTILAIEQIRISYPTK